jgi:ABC-type hemin transport system substrate-binding protein
MRIQPDTRPATGQDAPHDRKVDATMSATRPDRYPQRIVCLTEETTETLYLLHEDWRIVGISTATGAA